MQFHLMVVQPLRETGEQLVDATLGPIALLSSAPRVLAARREIDRLVAPHSPQRELPLLGERTQQGAREQAAIDDPDVAHLRW
jgi:hypothetical protein